MMLIAPLVCGKCKQELEVTEVQGRRRLKHLGEEEHSMSKGVSALPRIAL